MFIKNFTNAHVEAGSKHMFLWETLAVMKRLDTVKKTSELNGKQLMPKHRNLRSQQANYQTHI